MILVMDTSAFNCQNSSNSVLKIGNFYYMLIIHQYYNDNKRMKDHLSRMLKKKFMHREEY